MAETSTNTFKRWTEKHAEIWKFIKFSMAGGGSSAVELGVHMLLVKILFKDLTSVPITNSTLNMIGIESKGYLFAFMISTTIGYLLAFIINRKVTFKADSNPTVSIILYFIMVAFTILANGWIGSALTAFAESHNWTGGVFDLIIKLIGMAIPTLWTYPLNRFVIHRHKKVAVEEAEEQAEES